LVKAPLHVRTIRSPADFRGWRRINHDERLAGSIAVAVKGAGREFLTGAGLTPDQHGDVTVCRLPDCLEHVPHRSAPA
jgi:hypothetical protein